MVMSVRGVRGKLRGALRIFEGGERQNWKL
jgi:hypothetical protein